MIERDFNKYLTELAKGEFKDNILAQVLKRYWKTDEISSEPKKIFDKLVPLVRSHIETLKDEQSAIQAGTPSGKDEKKTILKERDFRILSLLLSSVRGIQNQVENKPYGINLTSNGQEPCSAIIVGNNGSGKTSIFSALEYIYANEIAEARLRKFGEDKKADFYEYLKRSDKSGEPFCKIAAINKTYDLKNRIVDIESFKEMANPQASFISEYEVFDYGQGGLSGEDDFLHKKITELLGFKEYVDFVEYLNTVNTLRRRKEITDFEKNQKHINDINENIKKREEEIRNLSNKRDKVGANVVLSNIQTSIDKLKERQKEDLEDFSLEEWKKEYSKFRSLYSEYEKKETSEIEGEKIQFLELGLDLLNKEEDCPFCKKSKLSIDAIRRKVNSELSKTKELSKINRPLSESYEAVLDSSKNLIFTLLKLNRIFENDIREFSLIPQMGELSDLEKELLEHRIFSDLQGILKKIEEFQGRSSYDKVARKELFQFLIETGDLLLDNDLLKRLQKIERKRRKTLDQVISEMAGEPKELNDFKGIVEIDFEIKKRELSIKESRRLLKDIKQEETPLKKSKEAFELIKGEVSPLLNRLEADIKEILEATIKPLEDTLKEALRIFLDEDKLDIDIDLIYIPGSDEIKKKRLVIKLVDKKSGLSMAPKKYFNTFRYKIFCGTLALGVAVASRKNSGINLPLIMDDEFFASDIVNRAEFENYFRKIIYMYRKITPELPLQFILFTHDELIFESAREATENVWPEIENLNSEDSGQTKEKVNDFWKKPLYEQTKFARLFPSSQKEDKPQKLKDGTEFWNLLYEFNLNKKINLEVESHVK